MKKTLPIIGLAFLATVVSAFAQKVQDKDHSFEYIRLPLKPLEESIINYKSVVTTSYAEEEALKKAEYEKSLQDAEAQHAQDLVIWEGQVQDAHDLYDQQMEDYKEKSTGTKILEKSLLNEKEPQLKLPPKPLKPYVREPVYRETYDGNLLASTYLKLEGYKQADENAVIISVILHGFESVGPKLQTKKNTYTDNGTTQTVTMYSYLFEYRHPMTIQVEHPVKGVIYSESIEAFNKFKEEKTGDYRTQRELDQKHNTSTMLSKAKEKTLSDNLKAANERINTLFGYSVKKRSTSLFFVEPKKYTYEEYQQALEQIVSGYNALKIDKPAATEKINKAIELWSGALKESTPSDKKSRINNDVTVATYLNLAEAYMWVDNYEKAEECLLKLMSLDVSRKERKFSEELAELIKDQRERYKASLN